MDLPLGGQLYLDAMSKLRKFPAISCLQIINDIGVKKKKTKTLNFQKPLNWLLKNSLQVLEYKNKYYFEINGLEHSI